MQSPPSPAPGHPVLRYSLLHSLLLGSILAVLNLANLAIEVFTGNYMATTEVVNGTTMVNLDDSGISTLLSCLLFLVALALSFVAGLLAAGSSRKVGTATLAGLLTGILGTFISGIVGFIVIVVSTLPGLIVPPGSTLSLSQLHALFIGTAIFGLVFGVVVTGGLGAGTGALGGLIGTGRYRRPEPLYQEPYYEGWTGTMPPPEYPYQPMPPYPPQPAREVPTYPPSPDPDQPSGELE